MGIIPARAGFTARVLHSGLDVYGSSPLARGLHHIPVAHVPRNRIIPARAGFTSTSKGRPALSADHPRSRGVYQWRRSGSAPASGSSPLARGLPRGQGRRQRDRGIIPARAGFTRGRAAPATGTRDHPRSRGVYTRDPKAQTNAYGSSPLARGLRSRSSTIRNRLGIIPARAGFTAVGGSRRAADSDHPRSRGVYPATRRDKIRA